MRLLADLHVFREHRLAQAIHQKSRLAVKAAATYRVYKVADQRRSERCLEQHRHLAGLDLARTQTRQRTSCRVVADFLGRRDIACVTRRRIPVVALHGLVLAGDHRTREVVARGRVAAHEAEAVGRDEMPFLDRDGRPFRVGHFRTDGKRGLLAAPRQVDAFVDGECPRMIKIEIGERLLARRQQFDIRQPGARIRRGETGDVERGFDRLAQRRSRKIRRARVSFLLSEIDSDADPLVAVVLDRLDLVATHGDRLPEAFGDVDLAVARTEMLRMRENVLRQLLQGLQRMAEARFGDRRRRGSRHGVTIDTWKVVIIAVPFRPSWPPPLPPRHHDDA